MGKIRSITVDTLTALQQDAFMTNSKKPGHDEWMDYGKEIYTFMHDLMELGFEIILILGEPGTGKSTGMRTLPHDSNIWYNADNKNPVWTGGKAEYGTKVNPRAPYHFIPKKYSDIIAHIKEGLSAGMFEDERYAFVTAHVEQYKTGYNTAERLKILGKVGTKMQLEGKMETVLYSRVEKNGADVNYILETQNNGLNTARSPMGMFEPKIGNDYNFILEKIIAGI